MELKLWYALGKLKAEKAAWRIAKERDIKLVTICSALLTPPPHLSTNNSTPTIAYLKGTFYFSQYLKFNTSQRLAEIA